MEVTSMSSLRSIVRPSLIQPKTAWQNPALFSTGASSLKEKRSKLVVVARKGKRLIPPQYRNTQPPPQPKFDPDGNPQFIIFVRNADLNLWFPLTMVEGGSTAKLMVTAKDTFLGKYIYKDTTARNLAAVIYKDEGEIKKIAKLKYRALNNAKEFRYGFKLVENGNMQVALRSSNVIELPRKEEMKSVVDKVKDFFSEASSEAKESFGKLTTLGSIGTESES
ncbi:multidrug resistance protein [Rhynchospora pubera]|uniref:Multidrug resistance protein n=1 Tax=Rhynchospora pubera TaxID=906938 RepID=A0AAV8D0B8_9POAL|nr:multidrug resistance protein [Rhynchospora pubera]KAJ4814389.1 multidrug resistance protein [Rhynchospora pubera]